ncbi:MAG: hypothetical protein E7292_07595 [Lachnospiraceae bacterium]|nr:hypothetical protein [Lachnospiraceae bacterium]
MKGKKFTPVRTKDCGNVGNIMVTGIFVLCMVVVMLSFMDNMKLIQQKAEVDQLARRYILRMETVGGLLTEDRDRLVEELTALGITAVDLSGTTMDEAEYGSKIELRIRGLVGGKYEVEETRVSTAKN